MLERVIRQLARYSSPIKASEQVLNKLLPSAEVVRRFFVSFYLDWKFRKIQGTTAEIYKP